MGIFVWLDKVRLGTSCVSCGQVRTLGQGGGFHPQVPFLLESPFPRTESNGSMSPVLTRLPFYVVTAGGLTLAMFLGTAVGSDDYFTIIFATLGLFASLWVVMSGERWWTPMMFALGIGGYFYIPWKLYPHEIALGLCGLAILPRIPFKSLGLRKPRRRLPTVFFLLSAYLVGHYVVSAAAVWNTEGLGNVSRAYLNALWPFIFGYALYRYGSMRVVGAGFRLMYLALLIRVSFGVFNFFADNVYSIPIINYTIDEYDLRASGYILFILASLMAYATRGPFARVGHVLVAILALAACITGGSRAVLAQIILFPLVLAVIFQKWRQLTIVAAAVALLFITVNLAPQALEELPYRVQRSLSVMVVGRAAEIEVQDETRSSDYFRQTLSNEGYRRWTESPQTLLFGTGIRRFDLGFILNAAKFELEGSTLVVQASADVGAYETSFWSILAVLGLVGMVLYASLLGLLAREVIPAVSKRHYPGPKFVATTWAAFALAGWFVTCWILGGFPSFEIFIGLMAKAIIEDDRLALTSEKNRAWAAERLAPSPAPEIAVPA
jgi:hypothetical protein